MAQEETQVFNSEMQNQKFKPRKVIISRKEEW